MIVLVDYGLGNIRAFANVYSRLNIPVVIAKEPGDFSKANKIILPGVGSFDYAMERLNNSGMRNVLENKVLEEKIPVMGICVGMQMLAQSSEEGRLPGLGWVPGEVKRFILPQSSPHLQIPHMGWNSIKPLVDNGLMQGFSSDSRFYFLHSYYFKCHDPANAIALTTYIDDFHSAIHYQNIYGVQFHPEKSHGWGVRLLENFASL